MPKMAAFFRFCAQSLLKRVATVIGVNSNVTTFLLRLIIYFMMTSWLKSDIIRDDFQCSQALSNL